jgi:Calcineurin-like phosphoesterase/Purple acid Phosphatase, N-terminal domain
MKSNAPIVLFLCSLFFQTTISSQTLVRGPYLQMGNQTAITIRWQTGVPTDSKVNFGLSIGSLNQAVTNNSLVTEHELRLTNLTPDTRYYYNIGTTSSVLQGAADNYFVTAPPLSTTRKIRVVGFGDCGVGNQNQRDVRDAFLNFRGTTPTDVWLLMGDNAYSAGLAQQYQDLFFTIYKDNLLKNTKLYPAPGNHEYNTTEALSGVRTDPVHYYDCFTLPQNGECGGVASGTESYYSFNYGGIHFVMMDSYGTENGKKLYDTTGLQAQWLKADLAANTQKWTIAVMHHPPYTKGSHNSDTEGDLIAIRERINPILERFGVDIALFGHSHVFERSFLINNHTGLATTFNPNLHQVSPSNAKYDGSANSCPINLTSQKTKHGTIYVVAGSAGQIGGAAAGWTHNAMFFSENQVGGSFYFEVEDNRLDASFLQSNGAITDRFTLMKEVSVKKTQNILVGQPVTLTASYIGNYSWTGGATSRSITATLPLGTHTYYVSDGLNCLKDTFIVNIFTALPVELTDFTAKRTKENTVKIEWQTASERQNTYFLLERSNDGSHFEILEKREGHPLSTKPIFYTFEDKTPTEGINYYRLSQIDLDGKATVLGIRSVEIKVQKAQIQVVPNPSHDGRVYFKIQNFEKKTGRIVVSDVFGRTVFDAIVDKSALSTGVYFVRLTEGGHILSMQKFVVE